MPELDVMIGGRAFQVSCQPGEEHFLRSAAAMLDGAVEDELRSLRARVAELEARPVATRDVAVVPPQVIETLAEIAARAEALAARVEERA
jgi:cell division protein ZapA